MTDGGKKFRAAVFRNLQRFRPSGATAELQERRQVTDLVIEHLGAGIGGFGVPIDARGASGIGGLVDSLDQRTAGTPTATLRVDEQIFEVTIAGRRPGREMKVK